jgi:ubiquinone/menaquinone biosynthesis C-methylase UbiE
MRDYYEQLWERLPEDAVTPDYERRADFLRAEVRPGDRALDLGSGAGEFTALLSELGARPVGVDVAEAALTRARSHHPGADFRLAPIDGALPLEDNSFDLVWSSEVIEHVADTGQWLSEVRRVLVPRGRLLLTTPAHGRALIALHGLERYSEPLGDHLHLYTHRSLRSLLEGFGFGEIDVRQVGGPPLLKRSLFARAFR